MGDLVDLSERRHVVTRRDRLVAIAMSPIPADHEFRAGFEAAVREIVVNPVNTNFDLHTDELDNVEFFLRLTLARSELERDEALLVSIMRMQKETGWNFLEDRRVVRFARLGPAQYLTYLQVMGTIALAWQVHTHPRDIILQERVLRRAC